MNVFSIYFDPRVTSGPPGGLPSDYEQRIKYEELRTNEFFNILRSALERLARVEQISQSLR